MPFPLLGVAKAALAVAPALLRRKPRGVNVGRINDKWMSMKPTGYLTGSDYAEADRRLGRGMEVLGGRTRSARSRAIVSATQRGLLKSPAADFLQRDIDRQESDSALGLSQGREDWLSGLRRDREAFDRQRIMQGWSNELGGALHNKSAEQAANAGFWNSMMEMAGPAFDFFSAGGGNGLPSEDYLRGAVGDPFGAPLTIH